MWRQMRRLSMMGKRFADRSMQTEMAQARFSASRNVRGSDERDGWEREGLASFSSGLIAELGVELTSVGRKDGDKNVSVRMEVKDKHMAVTGAAHGGSIAAVADTAIGVGCHVFRPMESEGFGVVSLTTDFIAPARVGDTVVVKASQMHGGRSMQQWRGLVERESDGKLLGSVQAVAMNLYDKKDIQDKAVTLKKKKKKQASGFSMHEMAKTEVQERFDQLSIKWETYVEKFKYEPVFQWLSSLTTAAVDRLLEQQCTRKGKKEVVSVLDLACGIGLVGQCLRANGLSADDFRMMGMDFSIGMLRKALDKTGVYTGGVLQHDIETRFPLDSRTFSLVTFCGASELVDLSLVLPEVRRVTQREGELWATFQLSEAEDNPTEHQGVYGMSEDSVRKLLSVHGFEVKDVVREPAAFYTPKPGQKDEVLPVPYLFVRAVKLS